jgi:Xaa-Pro aminopeptidase
MKLREKTDSIELCPLVDDVNTLRMIKDGGEIDALRKAAEISAEALRETVKIIRPGMTEKEIALDLESRIKKGGGERVSFDTIVASSIHSALPHAQPQARKIEVGDVIVIDYGAVYEGYHADETCTFVIGTVTEKQKKIYSIVKDAHDKALDTVKAGTSCKAVDEAARKIIEAAGYGQYFSHGTGHGVGLDVHEAPTLNAKSTDYLEEGMVITIEPGIYMPGLYGVRIEDMVHVQRDGCDIMTKMPKTLQVV